MPRIILKIAFAPLFLYLLGFFLFSPHLLPEFSSSFYCDTGDGLQNVWNLWWINKAVTELHQSPWFTSLLHFPSGVTLLGQTLNPFNGFVGIALLRFLTFVQAHNAIVVSGFVLSGWGAFLLCFDITGAFWSSLAGGAVFTFSNFHFTHAQGHMQLVSLEWFPFFAWMWRRLVLRPSIPKAASAAIFLTLALLCDYYYFIYCVLFGFAYFAYDLARNRQPIHYLNRKSFFSVLTFIALSGVGCLPLVSALLSQNHLDPFVGAHSSLENSADALSMLIPSYHWRFGYLTEFLWHRWKVNPNESGVFLGFSVMALIFLVWKNHRLRARKSSEQKFWMGMAFVFAIFSLGPKIHVEGFEVRFLPMPYKLLEWLFPPFRLSGMPVRMTVVVNLAASIITSMGLLSLSGSRKLSRKLVLMAIFVIWAVEMSPRPLPFTAPRVPDYIQLLAKQPAGALIDLTSDEGWALYYQTVHGKPMAFGYVSRVPESVRTSDLVINGMIQRGDWHSLACNAHFKYVLTEQKIKARLLNPWEAVGASHPVIRLYEIGC